MSVPENADPMSALREETERLRSALEAIRDKAMVAPFHRRLGRAIGEIHSITVSALGGAPVRYREPAARASLPPEAVGGYWDGGGRHHPAPETRDDEVARIAAAMIRVRGAHNPTVDELEGEQEVRPCAWCRLAAEQAIEAYERAGLRVPSLEGARHPDPLGNAKCPTCAAPWEVTHFDGEAIRARAVEGARHPEAGETP